MPRSQTADVGLIVGSRELTKGLKSARRAGTIWTSALRRSARANPAVTYAGEDVIEQYTKELSERYSPRIAGNVLRRSANVAMRPVRLAIKAASKGTFKRATRAKSYLIVRRNRAARVYSYAGWSLDPTKRGVRVGAGLGLEYGNVRTTPDPVVHTVGGRALQGAARRFVEAYEANIPKVIRAAARAAERRKSRRRR